MSNFGPPPTNGTVPPPFVFVPSVIQLNPFAQAFVDQANVQIAPWIMGSFTDVFLQGILVVQTTNYFNFHDGSEKSRRFTFLVAILQALCLLKTAQNIVIVWDLVVTNFANPDVAQGLTLFLWWHYTTSLTTALIATYVQSFFVYRYWLLTKRIIICIFMILVMTVSLVAAVLVIYYIPQFDTPRAKMWSSVHFTAAVVVDTAIVIGTSLHLNKQKSNIQSTADMINRLIRMTWQSAVPPAIMVILNMIVLEARPLELSHLALNMTAAKLYAIALMYTLNLRNELRGERMTSYERSNTGTKNNGVILSIGRPVPPTQSRRTEGIHVETHISTHATAANGRTVELRESDGGGFKSIADLHSGSWDGEKKQFHAL